jgi:hypothetical protein
MSCNGIHNTFFTVNTPYFRFTYNNNILAFRVILTITFLIIIYKPNMLHCFLKIPYKNLMQIKKIYILNILNIFLIFCIFFIFRIKIIDLRCFLIIETCF